MAKQAERKFGAMPEWAKTGPISLRNYPFRAEAHCTCKPGDRAGNHPTITRDGAEFSVWHEYFERHLGGRPQAFALLIAGTIREMTVPELLPNWLDPSFTPTPGWQSTWPEYTPRDIPEVRLYNTLVRTTSPQYAAMVARTASYPQPSRYWRADPNGRGIFVPHGWLDDRHRAPSVARPAKEAAE